MTIDQVLAGQQPWTMVLGDCRALLPQLLADSVDAVVTDPPYHLTQLSRNGSPRVPGTGQFGRVHVGERGFMGKTWDGGGTAFAPALWTEVLRVLKPGGHLLAFGGTRTAHRLVCAIEDAGFEIRDSLLWLYGEGMPKSLNLEGGWRGWGTGLKPAVEPIALARKPLSESSVKANVARWGVGALHIDACRISGPKGNGVWGSRQAGCQSTFNASPENPGYRTERHSLGRWPANVILDEAAAQLLDEQKGELTSGANPTRRGGDTARRTYGDFQGQPICQPARGADWGGASRFFYCAKADRSEREAGVEGFEEKPLHWSSGDQNPGSFQTPSTLKAARNYHPTVKPVDLMRWLVRLVTPAGGVVLDPFAGSGSTGMACAMEEVRFIGIEQEAEYVAIAEARIRHAHGPLFARVPHAD